MTRFFVRGFAKNFLLRKNELLSSRRMGAFFTNLHIRNASTQTVSGALPKLTRSRAYVSPANNSWVTVFTEATEDQDDKKLCAIASGLSKMLKADVVAFMVHDSDIALYWFYRCGDLADEFNSAPDHFGAHVSDTARERVRGNTDVLLPLCMDGVTREQLDEALHPADGPPTFAEEMIYELAKLLGIDDARASLGFNYFNDEGEQLLPDAGDFEPVGSNTKRKKSQETGPHRVEDILPDKVIPLPADSSPELLKTETPFDPEAIRLPDMYPLAIGMLTQSWSGEHEETIQTYSEMFQQSGDAVMKKMFEGFDQSARELLKKSRLPNLPTFDELKAARDRGPEALADLIAKKTPGQLTDIGISAATHRLEVFLAALLKRGLIPDAADARGRTTLSAAEQHGKNSTIYQLVKAAGSDGSIRL